MRAAAWTVALLALAAAAQAAVQVRERVATTPTTIAPPVTLVAASGTTTLGTSATSATTSISIPALATVNALKVHKVANNWDVKVTLVSASGFSTLESATVALVGATTQTQVVVLLGVVTQSSGATVALTGTDLTITAAGTTLPTGSLTLRIVATPQGDTKPVLTYPYTLTFA